VQDDAFCWVGIRATRWLLAGGATDLSSTVLFSADAFVYDAPILRPSTLFVNSV